MSERPQMPSIFHGLARTYKDGCRCNDCTEAATEAVRQTRRRQREARKEIETRLAARLRSALYHDEEWARPPRGFSPAAWENECRRVMARLERGNQTSRKAMAAA